MAFVAHIKIEPAVAVHVAPGGAARNHSAVVDYCARDLDEISAGVAEEVV